VTLRARLPFDEDTIASLGVGLKLFYEVTLRRKRVVFPTGFVVSCGVMMRPWNVEKL
jgi:hypothetical protein